MKKILTAIAVSIFVLGAARATPIFNPLGPVAVNFNAIVAETAFEFVDGKTNSSSTSTNISWVVKSLPTQTHFDGAALLALLANSYNINFPAGSQIGMNIYSGDLFVVDRTGTNIIFSPNSVVSFQFEEHFASGTTEIVRLTENASGTRVSGTFSTTSVGSVTLTYDDTFNTTADGTHTRFAFKGLYTVKETQNLKTHSLGMTLQFQGTGGGPVRDVPTVLTGTISGKMGGIVPTS